MRTAQMNSPATTSPAAAPARAWLARAWPLAAALLLPYGAVLLLLYALQERLLFQPVRLAADHRFAASEAPDVHEVQVPVDGATLSALHLRLPAPDGVVFFLHGNGGNLDGWFVNADFYRAANYDLFMIDYRGYGKSSGRITSEAQLRDDVQRAWQQIAPRYAGKRIVIYGRSLGTALAAQLAARLQPDLTVLVSPYISMRALAAEHYPWVPAALLRYRLDTQAALQSLRTPLLLVHGTRDAVIAPAHAAALQRSVPQAQLLWVDGAAHNDVQEFAVYRDALAAKLRQLAQPR